MDSQTQIDLLRSALDDKLEQIQELEAENKKLKARYNKESNMPEKLRAKNIKSTKYRPGAKEHTRIVRELTVKIEMLEKQLAAAETGRQHAFDLSDKYHADLEKQKVKAQEALTLLNNALGRADKAEKVILAMLYEWYLPVKQYCAKDKRCCIKDK